MTYMGPGDPFADDAEPDNPPPDDPRFEWILIRDFSDPDGYWIKGACHHLTPAPVNLNTMQLVAWWCPDCGRQFDADRWPCPENMWLPLPEVIRPANGYEKWIGADAKRATDDIEILPGGHVINIRHDGKPPMRDPDNPGYVILWQNPRMDDDANLIPWTRWVHDSVFLPVWNVTKARAATRTGQILIIAALFALMFITDMIGGFD